MPIRILGPGATRPYLIPGPRPGIVIVQYDPLSLDGQYCTPLTNSLDPYAVALEFERLQARLCLGWLPADYAILCLDQQLTLLDEAGVPAFDGRVNGQRFSGWIALSGVITRPLGDLLSHELGHELADRFIGPAEKDEFFTITGLPQGSNHDRDWHRRGQEVVAEYVTTAIWDMPLDERMAPITPAAMARLREWALNLVGDWPKAQVTVMAEPRREVSLTIGSSEALVNGNPVTLDVPAAIRSGRTFVPLRFLGESLGARVEWNEKTSRAHVRIGNARVIVQPDWTGARIEEWSGARKLREQWTELDVAPYIEAGRILVPLRFIAEALGFAVGWHQETRTVTISR